jgi:hypothetical protein
MEQPPGHRSDVVEESERGFGSVGFDCACTDEKAQVGVDLFGEPWARRQWCIRSRPDRPWPSERFAGTDDAERIT